MALSFHCASVSELHRWVGMTCSASGSSPSGSWSAEESCFSPPNLPFGVPAPTETRAMCVAASDALEERHERTDGCEFDKCVACRRRGEPQRKALAPSTLVFVCGISLGRRHRDRSQRFPQ